MSKFNSNGFPKKFPFATILTTAGIIPEMVVWTQKRLSQRQALYSACKNGGARTDLSVSARSDAGDIVKNPPLATIIARWRGPVAIERFHSPLQGEYFYVLIGRRSFCKRLSVKRLLTCILFVVPALATQAADATDTQLVERAVRDYIESQHVPDPARMERALDPKLAKRTYWKSADGSEFVMNTDFDTMVKVAKTYNQDGTKFPARPRVAIKILDIDQRVATVKLTADEWIDYLHLYKNQRCEWKIVNVLWQYHDTARQASKK
jgi:hypothetical protein